MAGWGWINGYPFEYGGGDSSLEEIYNALRAAMGDAVGPPDSIEDMWRQAEAEAIDSASCLVELAVVQAFPLEATFSIPIWEETLALTPSATSDQERREAIHLAETRQARADGPTLHDELEAISPKLSIATLDHARTRVCYAGKAFAAAGGAAFQYGPQRSSAWALFDDHAVVRVVYALEDGETAIPASVSRQVQDLMDTALPAHESYELIDDNDGFYFDGGDDGSSLFDQTPFD